MFRVDANLLQQLPIDLTAHRAAISTKLREDVTKFATVSLWTGRLCVSLGGAATVLMSLTRLLVSETNWTIAGLLAVQVVAALAAAVLSRQSAWRRHFLVLAVGMALLGAGVLCRIRWSTLVGGCTLTVYIVSLFGLIQLPDQL